MDPMTISAIAGAGLGLLKSMGQQGELNRNRQLQAQLAKNSTWSKMAPNLSGVTAQPNYLGEMFGGGVQGALFAQQNPGLLGSVGQAGAQPAQALPQPEVPVPQQVTPTYAPTNNSRFVPLSMYQGG